LPAPVEPHLIEKNLLFRLFWLFVVGSVIGCVYETLFCLVSAHRFEVRVSMLYGPFNLIYGAGAVTLYLTFLRMEQKPHILVVFLTGATLCSAVEYACSAMQQRLFGATSWDYSKLPLNIHGRVCLYAFLMWGALSLVWVWYVMPFCDRAFSHIPNRWAIPVTFAFGALFLLDGALTVAAMFRWVERVKGVAAANPFGLWLDKHWPDAFMRGIFTNLRFL